ncbi:MAG: TonB-dependent receptor plug domain-containing protein, partial [Muribaculaceae bacterium]|nr:TonB-dependent receptor plug domain-containing protein [Muribaculaceae bacterium]
MKHFSATILISVAALGAAGQQGDTAPAPVALRGISVATRRVVDIGRQETRIDSASLRESVALSLADVLGFNSSAYIKNFGRATLATVSFRGTSPSHTQVTWNGMRISSPMLGSTDFSMIPGYFVDDARLVHGSSSLADTGGGIGGLVKLGSSAGIRIPDGLSAQYVQGVGMWRTFDEFLRIGYGSGPWRLSLRTSYSSSPNDFTFINRDKKVLVYDDNNQVIGSYHPRERNRSGAFKDFHTLISASYDAGRAGRWNIDAWYTGSNRELPLLTTDHSSNEFENRQREHTLRTVASWQRTSPTTSLRARAGYIHTRLAYD